MPIPHDPLGRALLALASIAAAAAITPSAVAADDAQLQRMALCQDSWFDWKDDEARMRRFVSDVESRFEEVPQGAGGFRPKVSVQALGYPITQLYPQSVGMGVGFSLVVNADFASARSAVEQRLGRPLICNTSDGMRACELKLGEKKTALLVTGQNGAAKTSLVGCYYFYEK